jgi:hypothetical protein
MPGHAKVFVRPPPILVTDVAFAHITRHDEDFFGWPKNSCPAPCHTIPEPRDDESNAAYTSGAGGAGLFGIA